MSEITVNPAANNTANPEIVENSKSCEAIIPGQSPEATLIEVAAVPVARHPRKQRTVKELSPFMRWLGRVVDFFTDLFGRPQPQNPLLRRRERAIRYYRHQVRDRLRLSHAILSIALVILFSGVVCGLLYFFTDLIRPAPDSDDVFAVIIVLCILLGLGLTLVSSGILREIQRSAEQFGVFYTKSVEPDGTILVDPASDHDFGDRISSSGRVYVKMAEVYGWYCKAQEYDHD